MKKLIISCVIERSWFTQESPGLKPDWLEEFNLLSMKNSNKPFKIKRLKSLPQIGGSETGR